MTNTVPLVAVWCALAASAFTMGYLFWRGSAGTVVCAFTTGWIATALAVAHYRIRRSNGGQR